MVAGAYVAWYGWYEIRVLGGGDVGDPVIDTAAGAQRRLSGLLDQAGAGVLAAVLAALLVAAVVGWLMRRRRTGSAPGKPATTDPLDTPARD